MRVCPSVHRSVTRFFFRTAEFKPKIDLTYINAPAQRMSLILSCKRTCSVFHVIMSLFFPHEYLLFPLWLLFVFIFLPVFSSVCLSVPRFNLSFRFYLSFWISLFFISLFFISVSSLLFIHFCFFMSFLHFCFLHFCFLHFCFFISVSSFLFLH